MDIIAQRFTKPSQEVLDCGEAVLNVFVKNYPIGRYTPLAPNTVALKLASDSLDEPLMVGDEVASNDLLVRLCNCTPQEFHSLLIAMYAIAQQNSIPLECSIASIATRCEFPQIIQKSEELLVVGRRALMAGESLQLRAGDAGSAAVAGAIVYLISKVAQLRLKIFIIALEARVPTASISQAAAFLEMCPSVKDFLGTLSRDDTLLSSIKEMGKKKRVAAGNARGSGAASGSSKNYNTNTCTTERTHLTKESLLKEHYLLAELGYAPMIT